MSLVAYGNSDSDSDDDSSVNAVLPTRKPNQNSLVLPPPKKLDLTSSLVKEKDNKSIKISVPLPSAFDSDDDEPSQKKMKSTADKRGGLFALLPAPKNCGKRSIQKILIPQSVTKNTNTKVATKIATSDDEDVDESKGPLRFFTVEDKVQIPAHPMRQIIEITPVNTRKTNLPHMHFDENQLAALEQEAIQIQMEDDNQDKQFPFDEEIDDDPPTSAEVDPQMLQRLQGRRDRGKEEINFIDVSVAEEMPQGNELKRLTEETANQQAKPKGNPTPQQRRKHQITYLAYQAKERELELKNQWAQNRLTRRQTQSKYGF